MTTESHFAHFLDRMDASVAAKDDPHVIADETGHLLAELLEHPAFLEDRFREPAADHYRQHLVHVHPRGAYSVVSLVWRPGQATPIHDHRCWCVVGVLQGRELETRYHLYRLDEADFVFLVGDGESVYAPGQVCRLVPPNEDIHRVSNAGDEGLSISIHVYGTDIGLHHSSINHVFDQPVMDSPPAGARRVSWRQGVGR
jgi:predicted metal-dependent enzyme (double-stranded beta helix superfamily)